MLENILEVRNLKVEFETERKKLVAVDGNCFDIRKGKTTGLVGESGCGKSVSAFSIMRLIPNPPGRIVGGEVNFEGRDILKIPIDEMRKIRGKEISMIFQEPMTSLNPVSTVKRQLCEIFEIHYGYREKESVQKATEMLSLVGIPSPEKRLRSYPHELSGGMRQRVMIAMALSCSPKILIADEPTTALDVTIQAQILKLMNDLKKNIGMSTIFITHDLGVVAEMCDEVIVMYAGKIVEVSPVMDLFEKPLHPYTKGLMDSIPKRGITKNEGRLPTIDGMVPDLFTPPPGCRFADRCQRRKEACDKCEPELSVMGSGDSVRKVACHYPLG
ncbi:MAG: ABC transporter ATP-binding protein [Oligoflexales bacterium]|nr:ABC transporter ATP-binding protein [Oligoflexales bacterium]